ncbi:MAG: hypothetical protein ACOH2K_10570 [Burkholderiaceae bacterium]
MASVIPKLQAYRASILHFTADPSVEANSYQWHEGGLLLVADGRIAALVTMRNCIPLGACYGCGRLLIFAMEPHHSDACYRAIKTASALHADAVLNAIFRQKTITKREYQATKLTDHT